MISFVINKSTEEIMVKYFEGAKFKVNFFPTLEIFVFKQYFIKKLINF